MRILLDTHIYIWWLQDSPKLSSVAREAILNAEEVYVSSATIWEAAIKIGLGKLDANLDELLEQIRLNDFLELGISVRHAWQVAQLPSHHRDPFDRILISQAMCEPLRLLSSDKLLSQYSELVDVV